MTNINDSTALTVRRHLSIALTDKRKLELLDEQSKHIEEYKRLETHKTTWVAQTTKLMKTHRLEYEKISETVAQGMEMQAVACKKEINYLEGRITITRLDTNEIIEDRAIEEEDMKQ